MALRHCVCVCVCVRESGRDGGEEIPGRGDRDEEVEGGVGEGRREGGAEDSSCFTSSKEGKRDGGEAHQLKGSTGGASAAGGEDAPPPWRGVGGEREGREEQKWSEGSEAIVEGCRGDGEAGGMGGRGVFKAVRRDKNDEEGLASRRARAQVGELSGKGMGRTRPMCHSR